ncbi:dihydrolipoamide dehydrogenase [Rhodopila globiformis]|uniref:Dihydrolipoamide dehydrogenase n=2 Tax=Rhodopila globiformis TaxID=1071 RepID=A0A2S6NKB9_RHOGL|nr:dihydrolipoamide dehydrogenase [Rhodopila globiformis]
MDFDLAVIGAGSAGLSVAAGAAQLGVRVALIERGRMGGDCLNTGCVPSKALLAAAHAARAVREAGRFGVIALEPIIDWDRLRAHIRGVVAAIAPADSEARYRALGATVLRGEARFLDSATLSVDGRRLSARRFVVAAGSRAAVPAIPGLDQVPCWTNDTLFELAERPDHLLILGGGPVGLEMAAAFCDLGCAVTVVEAARIALREDPELAAGLRRVLVRRGVTIREGASVARVASGPVLVLSDGSRINGSHLLVAAGRTPNTEALDLPAAGIQADAHGIVTDSGLRSVSNRHVYAAGDIASPVGLGPRAFTHVGSYHAGIIIRRVLFRLPARLDYTALPRVIYTDPDLAQTGLTEAEAAAAGLPVRILRWTLADNDRAVAERDTDGLVKLVAVRGRIVGAGILAPQAGEMITAWSLAIARRTRLSALAGLIVPYPTRSEAAKRAATGAFMARLFSPGMKSLVRLLGRLP